MKNLILWAVGVAVVAGAGMVITNLLKELGEKTGIKCNAHSFRRTFTTESVRNGMNLFHVQSLLGHSSLTMTRIYAEQVNSEDAIKAVVRIVKL
jgi:site-specific recombinase XerD